MILIIELMNREVKVSGDNIDTIQIFDNSKGQQLLHTYMYISLHQ